MPSEAVDVDVAQLEKSARSSWTWTSSPQSVGEPRAGEISGGSSGSPRSVRILRSESRSVMNAMSRMSPPHPGMQNSYPTRAISFAEAIREVSCERGLAVVSQRNPVA
jgi:hypothetical protein